MLNGQSIAAVFTAGLMATAVFGAGAQAAPVTHNLALSFDGSAPDVDFDDFVSSNGTTFRLRSFGIGPITPFSLGEGDTVNMTLTFTGGGLTISDSSFGEQLFSMNLTTSSFDGFTDNPGRDPVVTYDRTREVTVTSFSGDYDGPFTQDPSIGNSIGAPTFGLSALGPFTDTTLTIFEMTITSTYTNIAYQPGFEVWQGALVDGFNLTVFDELDFVPAPGALALIGVGLIGLGAVRRQRTR